MCVPQLAMGALSLVGKMISANQAQKETSAVANARNDVLRRALDRNEKYAEDARNLYDKRTERIGEEDQKAKLQEQQDNAAERITANLAAPSDSPAIAISGSAPSVVEGEYKKKLLDAFDFSTNQAKKLGQLGGYSNFWLNEGLGTLDAQRGVNIQNNFAQGNMDLVPYEQDIAENNARIKSRGGFSFFG